MTEECSLDRDRSPVAADEDENIAKNFEDFAVATRCEPGRLAVRLRSRFLANRPKP